MKALAPIATVIVLTASGTALAGDDCHSPMAEWKSRDTVAAYARGLGVTSDRMRIDDGCYEIRGRDADGNRVELKIEPANLAILELEVRFRPGADASRYLPGLNARAGTPVNPDGSRAPDVPLAVSPTRPDAN